jgi:Uncharacterised nucleotidyltransferase
VIAAAGETDKAPPVRTGTGWEHSSIVEATRARRRLILELARDPNSPQLPQLSAAVDFVGLEQDLRRMRLLGLLGNRLLSCEDAAVPTWFRREVSESLRWSRESASRQQKATWGLLHALTRRGVLAVPLKGAFMSERLHGDVGLRLSRDIDLLVAASQMDAALGALEDLGCTRPRLGDALPLLHHILTLPNGWGIDLHWRINWYETAYTGEMLARSSEQGGVRALAPIDDLVSLLLFHARDGLRGMRYPIDLAAWHQRFGAPVTREQVAGVLERNPKLGPPVIASALTTDRMLGTRLVDLLPPAQARRRTRAAVGLADWWVLRPALEEQARTEVVDGLLTDLGGLPSFLGRSFFPRLPGPSRTRPIRQALYALALAWRAAVVLARSLRGGRP